MRVNSFKRFKVFVCLRTLFISVLLLTVQSVQAEDWVYTVRKGDNLWNITVDYLIDISYVKRVQALNNVLDPWYIPVGTKLRIPKQWVRHYPALIRVHSLQGKAMIKEEDSVQAKQLKVGDLVMLGDIVSTDDASTVLLAFLDGSRILLQEKSRLKIDSLMLLENTGMLDSQLHLLSGRLETQVIKNKGSARRFKIKTPVSVTSVRGTDYRVSADNKVKSKTEVVKGKVAVRGSGQSRLVPAGFGTVTEKDQEPKPPVELIAAPDTSQFDQAFVQIPIQFSLPLTEKIKGYRVQIAKTDGFLKLLFDKLFSTSIMRGPDLPDGDYFMRLRAIDSQQLEGHNAQTAITINARPVAPFLVLPKPGEGILLEETPNFSWTQQAGIEGYHLQIANDKSFSKVLIDQADIDTNELKIGEELVLGKYYWRIAAIDSEGDGPFSEAQMFRRILPAPGIEDPNITDNKLTIRSRRGLPGQKYHFQMSDDESFDELLVDEYSDEPGFEIARPDGGEYFIRVRTIDPDGFVGPFGTVQSIDVPYSLYWLMTLLPLLILLAL